MPIPEPSRHSIWNVRGCSCESNGTSLFETTLQSPPVCCQSQSRSAITTTLSSVTSPGWKKTFRLTSHSTGTATYRSDVHQVANRVLAQAILATDGSTRFGGTTTSSPLIRGWGFVGGVSMTQKKARLKWHCRRGMRELDLLLELSLIHIWRCRRRG